MAGVPLRTKADAKAVRQQYMNSLALESSNIQKNLNANLIYRATGTASIPKATETATERGHSTESKKQLIRDAVVSAGIMNSFVADNFIGKLGEKEYDFFLQHQRPLLDGFKPKGVPASVFTAYFNKYMKKFMDTQGVEYGLQQDGGVDSAFNSASAEATLRGDRDALKEMKARISQTFTPAEARRYGAKIDELLALIPEPEELARLQDLEIEERRIAEEALKSMLQRLPDLRSQALELQRLGLGTPQERSALLDEHDRQVKAQQIRQNVLQTLRIIEDSNASLRPDQKRFNELRYKLRRRTIRASESQKKELESLAEEASKKTQEAKQLTPAQLNDLDEDELEEVADQLGVKPKKGQTLKRAILQAQSQLERGELENLGIDPAILQSGDPDAIDDAVARAEEEQRFIADERRSSQQIDDLFSGRSTPYFAPALAQAEEQTELGTPSPVGTAQSSNLSSLLANPPEEFEEVPAPPARTARGKQPQAPTEMRSAITFYLPQIADKLRLVKPSSFNVDMNEQWQRLWEKLSRQLEMKGVRDTDEDRDDLRGDASIFPYDLARNQWVSYNQITGTEGGVGLNTAQRTKIYKNLYELTEGEDEGATTAEASASQASLSAETAPLFRKQPAPAEDTGDLAQKLTGSGVRGRGLVRKTPVEKSSGYQKPVQYTQFGRYLIHHQKLKDGVLQMRTPKGGAIKPLPTEYLTPRVKEMMMTMVANGSPSLEQFSRLTSDEKAKLHHIVKHSQYEKVTIPSEMMDKEDKDLHRFTILRGEIIAGNNNPKLVRDFKSMLVKFVDDGRIPRRQANEILIELAKEGL
ncbi:MAG: hypothetical protein EBU08_08250 [Micrococcales bacterium]|nr:hypothetical protein [Micrococcales bacterium]